MDLSTILTGGVVGVIATAALKFGGQLVGRNTTLTGARMAQGDAWTKALTEEKRGLEAEVKALEAEIGRLRAREMRLVKAATFLASHVENLVGLADNLRIMADGIAAMATSCSQVVGLPEAIARFLDTAKILSVRTDTISKKIESELGDFMHDPLKDLPARSSEPMVSDTTKPAVVKVEVESKETKKPEE